MVKRRLRLGSRVLEPGVGLRAEDGTLLPLGQRALAVLDALADAEGGVVTKAALLELVWPGQYVEEGNLTVQVAALRKALGPGADGREWIVTVPRVGYRLAVAAPSAGVEGAPASMPPRLSVMPFRTLGEREGRSGFGEAIAADLVTVLARFRTFSVVSGIANGAPDQPAAAYRLNGTVQEAGSRLRIQVRLDDASTGATLWADRFDGEVAAIFDFQDRVSERVATVIDPTIERAEMERSRRERPGSLAAYDIYLRSLARLTDESAGANAEAIALLSQALAQDPDNALFLAHAAWALEHRLAMGWPPLGPDDRERCIAYARRGFSLANGDARIMTHCGMALLQAGRDYEAGMAAVSEAFAINPHDQLVAAAAGISMMHCGDIEQARLILTRALARSAGDANARFLMTALAMIDIMRGEHEAALAWASRSLAVNASFDATYWMLAAANAYLGRMDEARRWLAELREIAPGVTLASIRDGQPAKYPDRIGAVLDGLALAGLE